MQRSTAGGAATQCERDQCHSAVGVVAQTDSATATRCCFGEPRDLGTLLGDVVKRVRIPTELADAVAKVLRESQSDKETFVRATTMRLQQQQLTIRAKLDRAYDDRLSGRIPDDLWTSKSAELEEQLRTVRAEMASHERASHDYERTGLQS